MASLELHGVRKSFGATPGLDDVSLSLEAREFIAKWGGRASVDSVGFRLVRQAHLEVSRRILEWLTGPCRQADPTRVDETHHHPRPGLEVALLHPCGMVAQDKNQRIIQMRCVLHRVAGKLV